MIRTKSKSMLKRFQAFRDDKGRKTMGDLDLKDKVGEYAKDLDDDIEAFCATLTQEELYQFVLEIAESRGIQYKGQDNNNAI